eukprot:SAG31_NODE_591_length_13740_cov_11.032256_8_plen_163_part_00
MHGEQILGAGSWPSTVLIEAIPRARGRYFTRGLARVGEVGPRRMWGRSLRWVRPPECCLGLCVAIANRRTNCASSDQTQLCNNSSRPRDSRVYASQFYHGVFAFLAGANLRSWRRSLPLARLLVPVPVVYLPDAGSAEKRRDEPVILVCKGLVSSEREREGP